MSCKICNVRLEPSESHFVCPKCGGCSNLPFENEHYDIYINHSMCHPIQYIRKDYFVRVLNSYKFSDEVTKKIIILFDMYIKTFDKLKIRKNMLSTKFMINKFCLYIGIRQIHKRSLKCKSSFNKVNNIWKKICAFNCWPPLC